MMKSMTGFGRCEHHQGSRKFTVEIKAVNHRYFDVNVKMPKKFGFFEAAIRSLLKSYVQRGKVDVFITCEDYAEESAALKYNAALAAEYLKYYRQMAETFGLPEDMSVSARRPSRWRRCRRRTRCSSPAPALSAAAPVLWTVSRSAAGTKKRSSACKRRTCRSS